ncbi:MAG: hypothetical protein C4520_01915 [Candidatus Abyssobacteria bacterium SURF_5]|uniref:Uncharacterized protein n=1 Tax=Abyssobacteria bacterium (strain SURF_5) TaxID=2093360 RepID=A0A3A4PCH2_ABYX5|nr:MAG: hypothetical protein C4520_01915 [Candidatus Abyssubacteria bacterium SURF_5]
MPEKMEFWMVRESKSRKKCLKYAVRFAILFHRPPRIGTGKGSRKIFSKCAIIIMIGILFKGKSNQGDNGKSGKIN